MEEKTHETPRILRDADGNSSAARGKQRTTDLRAGTDERQRRRVIDEQPQR